MIDEFIYILRHQKARYPCAHYYQVRPIYHTTVGEVAQIIKHLTKCLSQIMLPNCQNELEMKLWATLVSFAQKDQLLLTPIAHHDERGSFCELLKSPLSGQVSVSVTPPLSRRGGHYHHSKIEKFVVVQGQAQITCQHLITHEKIIFTVSDQSFQLVTIPTGYTHEIKNIGKQNLILVIWSNQLYDEKNADTYRQAII